MKPTTRIALFALAVPLAACVARAAPAAENWDNHCSSCHGADGKGQTKQGKKLKLRDYTDAKVQAEMTDAEMLRAILEGVKDKDSGKERMKPYREEMSEEEAKELVAYIRQFKA
ncbi:MAG: c-type cytochrome [Opitutaceae bacterium]|nr:c-type cytochrome [Opitutaceae bacterium]